MLTQRSRLSKRKENQSKKNLFISLLGIVVVSFLLIKLGIPSLVNFSLFISGEKNSSELIKGENIYISPPILDALPPATNSAKININGTGQAKSAVKLYINNEIIDEITIKENSVFSFEDIKLSKGENKIKAKVEKDGTRSDFSSENIILYLDAPPSLIINSPQDGETFTKDENPIIVSGKTDVEAKLTINSLWAIVKDDGSFTYNFSLKQGENEIKIIATDMAGNKTEVIKKVTYNP